MLFALLVLAAAFLIEGIGTYVSVVGLSSLFAANPVIILLAVSLDIGKVVAVSFLYKYWSKIGWLMKSYMSVAALVLMLITSSGAFGYLSGEFQKAIADTSTGAVITASLTEEQGRLQKRKEDIDKQISQLKDDNVGGRTRLMRSFGPEIKRINDRLADIDKELPKLKVEAIKKNVEVGPIIYIADAFNTTPEKAVKWVILLIIFVFDPLAISLLLAGNYLIELRKQEKKQELLDEKLDKFELEKHSGEFPVDKNNSTAIVEPEITQSQVIQEFYSPETISESNDTQNHDKEHVENFAPNYKLNIQPENIENTQSELINKDIVEVEIPVEKVIQQPIEESKIEEIEIPFEKFTLTKDIPELDPIQETTDENREVITLEQITKPKKPVYRSMLEDVNSKHGDLQTDEEDRSRSMKKILDTYKSDTFPESEKTTSAVVVGGPPDRVN